MGLFDGFNVDELVNSSKKFEEENKNNGGEYEELPDGKYEVAVVDMDFTTSKSGKPMIKYEFQVVSGNHENQHLWIYNVIDPNSEYFEMNIHTAKVFINSMLKGVEDEPVVTTESIIRENANLIKWVFGLIEDNYEYLLEKKTKRSKNGKDYTTYTIKDIYPLD